MSFHDDSEVPFYKRRPFVIAGVVASIAITVIIGIVSSILLSVPSDGLESSSAGLTRPSSNISLDTSSKGFPFQSSKIGSKISSFTSSAKDSRFGMLKKLKPYFVPLSILLSVVVVASIVALIVILRPAKGPISEPIAVEREFGLSPVLKALLAIGIIAVLAIIGTIFSLCCLRRNSQQNKVAPIVIEIPSTLLVRKQSAILVFSRKLNNHEKMTVLGAHDPIVEGEIMTIMSKFFVSLGSEDQLRYVLLMYQAALNWNIDMDFTDYTSEFQPPTYNFLDLVRTDRDHIVNFVSRQGYSGLLADKLSTIFTKAISLGWTNFSKLALFAMRYINTDTDQRDVLFYKLTPEDMIHLNSKLVI